MAKIRQQLDEKIHQEKALKDFNKQLVQIYRPVTMSEKFKE